MMDEDSGTEALLRHYGKALQDHGDTPQGACWPNAADLRTRFDVMLDVTRGRDRRFPVVLCDLGCGTGELLGRIRERKLDWIQYIGVDRLPEAIAHARSKFPDATFIELDVNADGADLSAIECDYLVANGLFTVKWELEHERMQKFLESTVTRVWPRVRQGIAFNVMSKVVDWERPDLFHVPMDDVARLLHRLAGRRVTLRADYGLYEYTAYAHRGAPESSAGDR